MCQRQSKTLLVMQHYFQRANTGNGVRGLYIYRLNLFVSGFVTDSVEQKFSAHFGSQSMINILHIYYYRPDQCLCIVKIGNSVVTICLDILFLIAQAVYSSVITHFIKKDLTRVSNHTIYVRIMRN